MIYKNVLNDFILKVLQESSEFPLGARSIQIAEEVMKWIYGGLTLNVVSDCHTQGYVTSFELCIIF